MILVSGCFDGLHAGHVRYLQAAQAYCLKDEVLVCAVAPDEYIEHTKKRRPYWSQAERLYTVGALPCVDVAIAQRTESVASIIAELRPRIFIKGIDWKDHLPADVVTACERVGTALAFVDTEAVHTSKAYVG